MVVSKVVGRLAIGSRLASYEKQSVRSTHMYSTCSLQLVTEVKRSALWVESSEGDGCHMTFVYLIDLDSAVIRKKTTGTALSCVREVEKDRQSGR